MMKESEEIKKDFILLYQDFMTQVAKDNFDLCIVINQNSHPSIDFQRYTYNRIDRLERLPSYIRFCSTISKTLKKKVNPYFLFGHIFTETYKKFNSIKIQPHISNNIPNIEDFNENIEILVDAFQSETMNLNQKVKNSFLITLQGIEVEKRIQIPGIGYIDSLEKDSDGIQFLRGHDFSWPDIYTGIYIEDENHLKDDYIIVLMTILRLYKKNNIRFIQKHQEARSYIFGRIFIPYTEEKLESNYHEEPSRHSLTLCKLDSDECDNFISFYESLLPALQNIKHSCEYFNRAVLSPEYFKELLLFIVIESFFRDIQAEVTYRLSISITILLNEDEEFYSMLKELYKIRSKLAHGSINSIEKNRRKIYKDYNEKIKKYTNQNKPTKEIASTKISDLIEGIVRAIFIEISENKLDTKELGETMESMAFKKIQQDSLL